MYPVKSVIKTNNYRDSIFLMKISAEVSNTEGVQAVSAMMATDRNKELFAASELLTPEIKAAHANDLAIAIKAAPEKINQVVERINELLEAAVVAKNSGECGAEKEKFVWQAKEENNKRNFSLISVAGDYAKYEAALALNNGMDVMLYSDNISLEDELALKTLAKSKGLLVMGPDCGTAIIDGTPLAFANHIKPGKVGVIGASGTGLQEVCCLLDRMGVGVKQAYGTGGRDLKDDIGGITTLTALERLTADPELNALVILGKPPGAKTRKVLAEKVSKLKIPVFVHYMGAEDYTDEKTHNINVAKDLTELSVLVAKKLNSPHLVSTELPDMPKNIKGKGWLCGIFGGGTLCQEAAEICGKYLQGEKSSNLNVKGYKKITGKDQVNGHVFWDLGEDEFTVGKPHPMMAPDIKMERLVDALCNPNVSVILLDMVIGFGSHPKQAELVNAALEKAYKKSKGASKEKIIVASVCGTESDIPSRSSQVLTLQQAGIEVLASNALAAIWAAKVSLI